MTNLIADVKAYLIANLDLASDGTLTYSSPFAVAKPELSDRAVNMIALTNAVNEAPITQLSGFEPLAYMPRMQVMVRAERYQDGESMIRKVVKVLEPFSIGFVGASGSCYSNMMAVQLPTKLAHDKNDLHLWSWNYSVIEHNSDL